MNAREQIGLLLIAAAALSAGIAKIVVIRRRNPQERERKRRLAVNTRGRLGDAVILDASDDILYYSYKVAGVVYTANQDIATLRQFLPGDPEKLIGVAALKYEPNNPANSILVCEQWSGLRLPAGSPAAT